MSEPGPARKLTLLDATLLVMGGIIGVGIFFNPHTIAARVPEPVPYLLLWVFGGLVAIAAGFTFAELGGTFPKAGGWFVYLRAAFGRPLAFVFAWVVLCVQSTGAIASIAKFCASRVRILVPGWFGERAAIDGETLVAALLVGSVTLVALTGVKRAALVQNACMVTKLLVIAALIAGGLLFVGAGDAPAAPLAAAAAPERMPTPGGFVLALLPLFYTLGGWQLVGYIAPEVKDPVRNVPRAILFGVAGVVLVYLAINASYLAVLGIDGLASDPGFAQTLSERAFGPTGEKLLAAGMCISAFGICVVNIIATPWLYVAMAREGLFFESVGALDARTGVPRRALLLQAGFTCVYLLFTLDFLVDSVVFVEWIFHLLAAAGLLLPRVRQPDLPRPYRSPLYPLAPLAYLAAALVVVGGNLLAPEARYLLDSDGDPVSVLGFPIELRALGLTIVLAGALAYRPWRALVERTRTA
jgi:APA family basic amino acid/polyamine antiporter